MSYTPCAVIPDISGVSSTHIKTVELVKMWRGNPLFSRKELFFKKINRFTTSCRAKETVLPYPAWL